jgi:hypothetical protein
VEVAPRLAGHYQSEYWCRRRFAQANKRSVHPIILSRLSEPFGLSSLHANQLESPKSASPSLLPRRVVERSREEMEEKRALILGKALQGARVHLFLKGGGDLF